MSRSPEETESKQRRPDFVLNATEGAAVLFSLLNAATTDRRERLCSCHGVYPAVPYLAYIAAIYSATVDTRFSLLSRWSHT
jgi:hypothetical protein